MGFVHFGVVPMATYGADHLGLNKSLRKQLDSMAVKAAGNPGFQCCSTTLLHIKLGCRPSDIIMHKVVVNFTVLWSTLGKEERSRVGDACEKVRSKITALSASQRWRAVFTPLGAAVACLLEAQWHPDTADRWLSANRTFTYAIGVSHLADSFALSELKLSFAAIGWTRAASHFCGEGIDQGTPSFEGLDKANRKLTKVMPHLKPGLLSAVSGGAVVGSRFSENQGCALCVCAVQDAFHRYYSCPALSKSACDDFSRQ